MKIPIFLIMLIFSTFQLREYALNSKIFQRIKASNLFKQRFSCLSDLSGKNLTSNFSELFNDVCDLIKTCYKDNSSTKEECDEEISEFLTEKCETADINKSACLKVAEVWKSYIINSLIEYYEKESPQRSNKVKFLNLGESLFLTQSNYDKFTLLETASELALYNIIPVEDNNFVIKNTFSDVCFEYVDLSGSSGDPIIMADCDLEKDEQHWFFSDSEKSGFVFIKSYFADDAGDDACIDTNGGIEACAAEDGGINWLLLHENGDIAKVEDFGLVTK